MLSLKIFATFMLQHVYALTLQNVEDAKSTDVPDGASTVEDDSLTREEVVEY